MQTTYYPSASHSRQPQHTISGWLLAFVLFTSMAMLSACGGSTGITEDTGEVFIGLTDAEGDFVNYTVDVVAISLTRADGNVVDTLPLTTRVDFSQYTDLTEFLTAATVPAGRYVQGTVTLDYSNADIWVEDANGVGIKVNSILDTAGNPVTTMNMSVQLDGINQLPIAPGIPSMLNLDFDLEASNNVDFSNGEPVVTVDAVLIAEVDRESPNKQHRLRGPLKEVNVADSYYQVYIRPFHHRIADREHRFGEFKIHTNDTTVYEIDGVMYEGAAGLEVLATMPQFTATVAIGKLRLNPLRFVAREVYAGSSVPGGDLDVVKGSVIARSGDDIIVKGATLTRTDGTVVFNDTVTVSLDDSTTVTKQLASELAGIDDVSVGQRVTVFGTLTNDELSDLQFSAANGYLRMLLSNLRGTVVKLPDTGNYLTMNLHAINGRNPEIYDFTGTGVDTANDADPMNYEIDSGALTLDELMVEGRAGVRGHVTPFGMATPDFNAQTIVTLLPGE